MMLRIGAVVTILVLAAGSAAAQVGSGGYGSMPSPQPMPSQQTIPDQAPTRAGKTKAKPAPSKADILRDAAALVKSTQLPCEVSDASQLNEGTATVNGKNVHVRTFEAACSNGMGYFLVEQPPEQTIGFSCFSAAHTREADQAQGREPGPACSLPANADLKAMAGSILSKLGMPCQVTNVRSIGQEVGKNTEFTEAACTGGTGYVISSALPGSTTPPSAQTCVDAFKRGVSCKMSSTGPPALTMQTFKDALAQHNVSCNAENLRLVGKETVKQRHVVEFKCPEQQPNGIVAFIPLEGNSAPFETMDCPKAASRYHIICTLTAAQ
jgi:hypothetical protein